MTRTPSGPIRFGDLGIRVLSGLVLAAIAFIDVWHGGHWATALVVVLLLIMLREYQGMTAGEAPESARALAALLSGGVAAPVLTAAAGFPAGLAALAAAGLAAGLLARPAFGWMLAGSLYIGGAMCALLVFRAAEPDGFHVILWLVLVVVAADVGAYFTGRTLGGRKLWPRVSPGKTWSGAIGGLAFALAVGLAFALAAGWPAGRTAAVSLGLGIASQLGDLLESAVKRRFGVKDSGWLIPGHGGVMDRLDGITGAAWFLLLASAAGWRPEVI